MDYGAMMPVFRRLALEAGAAIMEIYNRDDVDVRSKADASPVTEADEAADAIIRAGLADHFSDIPVVTEEFAASQELKADTFIIVDPLDGTSEFVEKTGEFTVNIALMKHNKPWLGFVVLPQVGMVYAGGDTLEPVVYDQEDWWPCRDPRENNTLKVVVSGRAANSDAIAAFKQRLNERGTPYELVFLGSAYKYCELLKYRYAIYPRYGLTSHWDTAAGQALLAAAGGAIVISSGQDLSYPSSTLLNSPFLALSYGCADAKQDWLSLF